MRSRCVRCTPNWEKDLGTSRTFISVVTVQEIAVAGIIDGKWEAMRADLSRLFGTALEVTEAISVKAARLFVDTRSLPLPKGKSAVQ